MKLKPQVTIITFVICLSACKQAETSAASTAPVVERWEYMQSTSFTPSFPADELNKLGAEGWELVSYVEDRQAGLTSKFVLKRRVANPGSKAKEAAVNAGGN